MCSYFEVDFSRYIFDHFFHVRKKKLCGKTLQQWDNKIIEKLNHRQSHSNGKPNVILIDIVIQ